MTNWPPFKRTLRMRLESFVWDKLDDAKWQVAHLRQKTSVKLHALADRIDPHLKTTEEVIYELFKMSYFDASEEEIRKHAKDFVAEFEADLEEEED